MLKTIGDLRERKGLERTEGFVECTVLTAVVCISGEQSSQLVQIRSKKEEMGIQQNIRETLCFP